MSAPVRWRSGSRGWWPSGPTDTAPKGSLRRATGVHPVRTRSIRSRNGSTLLSTLAGHSITRFDDHRYVGAGTVLYRDGYSIKTGLDGARLTFLRMPPQVGGDDYLFVAGGGDLFKVNTDGTTSPWGITAPPNGFTASKGTQRSKVIDAFDAAAGWTASSATLVDEATIKQEGGNSMKMTVVASTTGTATKAIAVDLANYAAPAQVSSDEDFITVWVRVDNPDNMESLGVMFDLSGGAFATDYFHTTITATSGVIPPADSFVSQTVGLADLPEIRGQQEEIFSYEGTPVGRIDRVNLLANLGQVSVTTAVGVWIRLRLPKVTFQRAGDAAKTWANVVAMRVVVKTNARGSVIVYWDDAQLVGGAGLQGTYQYKVTYLNNTTGSRSNANATAVSLSGVERQPVSLASLPASTDPQVTHVEVWRTLGGGTRWFYVGKVTNGTTTFTDNYADFPGLDSVTTNLLASTELPEDNDPPDDTYDVVVSQPFAGRAWWLVGDAAYYSADGRPEGVQGFITPTHADDPLRGGVVWNGSLYLFSVGHIFQVIGDDEPFIPREVFGAPGTVQPLTIVGTSVGILYQANDGVRVFDGAQSTLIADAPLGPLFRGEALEGVAAFEGMVAAFGRNEYLIANGVETLAFNVQSKAWRVLGLACTALAYAPDDDEMLASFGTSVVALDVEGTDLDGSAAIPFAVEYPGRLIDEATEGIIKRLYIEADTNGQALTPSLVIDGVVTSLASFATIDRATVEYAALWKGRVVGVRLTGSLTAAVEVFGVRLDVYVPTTASVAATPA